MREDSTAIFETERLRIRPFDEQDVDNLYLLYSDPEVMRYMRGVRNREQAEKHIPAFAEQFEETGFTIWALEEKLSREFVGRAGLWPLPGTTEVELGYMIVREHQGNGFATEASAGCLEFGFQPLSLDHIAAISQPGNLASRRVLAKLGFEFIREDRFYDVDVLYHRLERINWTGPKRG